VFEERKSVNNQDQNTNFDKSVDTSVSIEEESYKTLVDYLEYFDDPVAWFVDKEHPSFDGG